MSIKKYPPDDPTQQQIIKGLEARVEEERAKLMAALQQPRLKLNLRPSPCDVRLQIAPIFCWCCHALVKAARGYITQGVRSARPGLRYAHTDSLHRRTAQARPQAFSRQPPL